MHTDIRDYARSFPIVVVAGVGGSGKTVALLDWAETLAKERDASAAFTDLQVARHVPPDWIHDLVWMWKNMYGRSDGIGKDMKRAFERLRVANGDGRRPLLHLGVDNVNEQAPFQTREQLKGIFDWFMTYHPAITGQELPWACLVFTCRTKGEFEDALFVNTGTGYHGEEYPIIEVGDFHPPDLARGAANAAEQGTISSAIAVRLGKALLRHRRKTFDDADADLQVIFDNPSAPEYQDIPEPILQILLHPTMWHAILLASSLWSVVEGQDDAVGDVALAALAGLGIPINVRARPLEELHRRLSARSSVALLNTARYLADPSTIDVLRRTRLARGAIERDSSDARHWIRVLADVADARPEDPELQDKVWKDLESLFRAHPDTFDPALYLGSDVVPRCNSPLATGYLLSRIGEDEEGKGSHRRYLLYLRLAECVRPRQLDGWRLSGEGQVLATLRNDATENSGSDSRDLSGGGELKEAAFDLLLRLGDNWIVSAAGFEACVAHEMNRYLRGELSGRLARFRLDPLPATVLDWVTEPHNDDPQQGDIEIHWRSSAIEVVGSVPSRYAFDALRSFGFRYGGDVLWASVDALSEQAVMLAQAGNQWVEDLLVETVFEGPHPWNRSAAIAALEDVAAMGALSTRHLEQFESLIENPNLSQLDLAGVIGIWSYAPTARMPAKVMGRIREIAMSPEPGQANWAALHALAHRKNLEKDPELMRTALGLERMHGTWEVGSAARLSEQWSVIVGSLYRSDPRSFGSAMAFAVRNGDLITTLRACGILESMYVGKGRRTPEGEVRTALIDRLLADDPMHMLSTQYLESVVRLVPDAFAYEPLSAAWRTWRPEWSVVLADGLGRAPWTSSKGKARLAKILTDMTEHRSYTVRRSAYRALASMAEDRLQHASLSWLRSQGTDERRRAAEAAGWVSDDLVRRLATDEEPSVRTAAEMALKDRRKRVWAEEYLIALQSVSGQTNQEMLDVWPQIEALMRVGDDAMLWRLHDLEALGRLPHGRRVLRLISERVRKRWDEATRDWEHDSHAR